MELLRDHGVEVVQENAAELSEVLEEAFSFLLSKSLYAGVVVAN